MDPLTRRKITSEYLQRIKQYKYFVSGGGFAYFVIGRFEGSGVSNDGFKIFEKEKKTIWKR